MRLILQGIFFNKSASSLASKSESFISLIRIGNLFNSETMYKAVVPILLGVLVR